jgi:hypothetical protein
MAKTNDFKDAMARAHKLAAMLPGGDVPPEEQDDVIAALEELRDRKRCVVHCDPSKSGYSFRNITGLSYKVSLAY